MRENDIELTLDTPPPALTGPAVGDEFEVALPGQRSTVWVSRRWLEENDIRLSGLRPPSPAESAERESVGEEPDFMDLSGLRGR